MPKSHFEKDRFSFVFYGNLCLGTLVFDDKSRNHVSDSTSALINGSDEQSKKGVEREYG